MVTAGTNSVIGTVRGGTDTATNTIIRSSSNSSISSSRGIRTALQRHIFRRH